MRNGGVKAGNNPASFSKENSKEWVYIDDGAKLRMATSLGDIEIISQGNSYLRGGLSEIRSGLNWNATGTEISIISLPRSSEVASGTKQSLNAIIKFPIKK